MKKDGRNNYIPLVFILLIVVLLFKNNMFSGNLARNLDNKIKLDETKYSVPVVKDYGTFTTEDYGNGRQLVQFPKMTSFQSPPSSQQLVFPLQYNYTSIEEELCTTPEIIEQNPTPGVGQHWPDINGRYIVWHDISNQSATYTNISGYDLGLDMIYGTSDDTGPIKVMTNVYSIVGGSGNGLVYPRINSNGLVAFTRGLTINTATNQPVVQLVTCNFYNCQNTINVIDTVGSTLSGGIIWFPHGQFIWHDINNNNKMVIAKSNFSLNIRQIIEYDINTGSSQVLYQVPGATSPLLPNIVGMDARIDESNLISWVRVNSPVFGTILYEFYLKPINSINPVLITTQSGLYYMAGLLGPPPHAIASSSTSHNYGNLNFFVYPVAENNILYWDLKLGVYITTINNPINIFSNDNRHQLYPRITFNSLFQAPMLVFTVMTPTSMYTQTKIHNNGNNFVDYKRIIPPPNWPFGLILTEASDFNVVGILGAAIPSLAGLSPLIVRVAISKC